MSTGGHERKKVLSSWFLNMKSHLSSPEGKHASPILCYSRRERDRESKRNLCCHQCWAYAGIIRGGNLALMQTSNCQKNNLSQTKERPLWCWGLWFLSYLFLWGFTWQNAESCFVPLPVMLHPLTGVPPPPLSLVLSLSVSHVVLLSVLSAHSLAPALMFLISLI